MTIGIGILSYWQTERDSLVYLTRSMTRSLGAELTASSLIMMISSPGISFPSEGPPRQIYEQTSVGIVDDFSNAFIWNRTHTLMQTLYLLTVDLDENSLMPRTSKGTPYFSLFSVSTLVALSRSLRGSSAWLLNLSTALRSHK